MIDTEKAPNPWTVTSDFCKTVITLASALLGLTVTFASGIAGGVSPGTRLLLYFAWGFMVATILAGIVSHGLIVNKLKNDTHSRASVFFANASFYGLLVSAILFAVFGASAVRDKSDKLDAKQVVELAIRQAPHLAQTPDTSWKLKKLTWNKVTQEFDLELSEAGANKSMTMSIDEDGSVRTVTVP